MGIAVKRLLPVRDSTTPGISLPRTAWISCSDQAARRWFPYSW
ncbi:hypothetical protein CPter291_1069 [Collimonas pratensis]|uniref:Uncharacterized protein n=1 Tax=Collimonas pratensis TaxID=279113 RepID=A0ABM5Z3P8_9BURK|nr:hypothetical protein CPter291_1069 [Collimonas pratensis]